VKGTKRQGRIAHHHTDATVPHIVALPGFSFHVAKIGIPLQYSKQFVIFFCFRRRNRNKMRNFAPSMPTLRLERAVTRHIGISVIDALFLTI